jgi:hypothetical protein
VSGRFFCWSLFLWRLSCCCHLLRTVLRNSECLLLSSIQTSNSALGVFSRHLLLAVDLSSTRPAACVLCPRRVGPGFPLFAQPVAVECRPPTGWPSIIFRRAASPSLSTHHHKLQSSLTSPSGTPLFVDQITFRTPPVIHSRDRLHLKLVLLAFRCSWQIDLALDHSAISLRHPLQTKVASTSASANLDSGMNVQTRRWIRLSRCDRLAKTPFHN